MRENTGFLSRERKPRFSLTCKVSFELCSNVTRQQYSFVRMSIHDVIHMTSESHVDHCHARTIHCALLQGAWSRLSGMMKNCQEIVSFYSLLLIFSLNTNNDCVHIHSFFWKETTSALPPQCFLKFDQFQPTKFLNCIFSNFKILNPPWTKNTRMVFEMNLLYPLRKKDTAMEELKRRNISFYSSSGWGRGI